MNTPTNKETLKLVDYMLINDDQSMRESMSFEINSFFKNNN